MFQYECPECGKRNSLAQQAAPGKKIRCAGCQAAFTPRAETLGLKDEPLPARPAVAKPGTARPAAAKPAAPAAAARPAAKPAAPAAAPPPPPPPPPPPNSRVYEEEDANPYGVLKETEEELLLAEKNKPKFGDVADKFKKSTRGPASALLVLPTNLLVGEGSLTGIAGVMLVIVGLWPLIFTDASPSDEEYAEQLVWIFGGFVLLLWGSLVCMGASKMQNLESYAWALIGSVMGIFPLLAGIFAIIALRDPRVIAGFEEVEGSVDGEDEDEEKEKEDDEEDEEEDEEEEEEERPKKKRKK
ncbi:hypothetical protein [Fimbriiglobus ruber]|uniref:Uncharacterized protein n=1 Tax=Fimbriiglobus ruber TaxID=1908690 RepID=A0A225DQD9_9BACT|nr:hypothetical protein [Fimbriiglobus ruber]OWK38575.1 hypothetical protein FRUB_07695 [Fimbriiglobus ruber]